MKQARIMDRPEDFKKLGINPNQVELWEEGRRDTSEPGHNEVWYFDATMEDGSKIIIGFRTKDVAKMVEPVDSPNVNIVITTPDGQEKSDFQYFSAVESHTGKGAGCDLKYGPNTAKGDLKEYTVHVEPVNGVGADLHYKALVEPFRQGTGIVAFGEHDEFYHTDLSFPKNRVTGTLFYDGKEYNVAGLGYHDHQWMNVNPMLIYHHWLWGRMYTVRYTAYIYDFVASEAYGFMQLPMFALFDNETGKLLFETDGDFTLETQLETQKQTGRDFPKTSHYIYKNADGKTVDFTITWLDEIEVRDMYNEASAPVFSANPAAMKQQFDAMNVAPIYIRYYAKGTVTFTDPATDTSVTSSGDMIYEYAYLGKPDSRAHL